jgi:hypothetical protein
MTCERLGRVMSHAHGVGPHRLSIFADGRDGLEGRSHGSPTSGSMESQRMVLAVESRIVV